MAASRSAKIFTALVLMAGAALAQTPSREHALELYRQGDVAGALAEVEQSLTVTPDNINLLLNSAQFNFDLGNIDAARGRTERLLKLVGDNATAWELLVQITQSQGDVTRRDEAIGRWKQAISSALDDALRRKGFLTRDRIVSDGKIVVAVDYFDRAGPDFTRYMFTIFEPEKNPGIGLLLRTDTTTTETWAATALFPPDQHLFHLDMVDRDKDGTEHVAIYQFYVGEPDYDTVRAKVLEILRGQVQPLSGQPGSLAGYMKQ